MENGKFPMFTPSLNHRPRRMRTGERQRRVNMEDTAGGGRVSGSLENIYIFNIRFNTYTFWWMIKFITILK